MNDTIAGRRPLKSRQSRMAQGFASWLSKRNITPNQISILSVVFAALTATTLSMRDSYPVYEVPLLLLAALGIQLRLLCNLMDGLVAVEGGKKTAAGEMFNDIPDRFADVMILVAAGYAAANIDYAVELGWMAAVLAVMTAYIRNLATTLGLAADFCGPMAKQHRMATMTLAILLSLFEPLFAPQGTVLAIALLLIVVGSLLTLWRRMLHTYRSLESA